MGYNLLISGVYWGYNPLILTIYLLTSNGTSKWKNPILDDALKIYPRSTQVFQWRLLEGALFVGIPGWFVENI